MSASISSNRIPAKRLPTNGADTLIWDRIDETAGAIWRADMIRNTLVLFSAVGGAFVLWLIVDQWIIESSTTVRVVCCLGLVAFTISYAARRIVPLLFAKVSREYAAQCIERDYPEFRQSLTSYVTLSQQQNQSNLGRNVVAGVGSQAARLLKQHDRLPSEATGTIRMWVIASVVLLIGLGYIALSPKDSLQTGVRLLNPIASVAPAKRVQIDDVVPGNANVMAGRSVEFSATVRQLYDDEPVSVVWQSTAQSGEVQLSDTQEFDGFVGKLDIPYSASGEIRYRIEAGDAVSPDFRLQIQDLPVVALQSVGYTPPGYTRTKPYRLTGGAISTIDGTQIEVVADVNRSIRRAVIEFNPKQIGATIRATAGTREMQISPNGKQIKIDWTARSIRGRDAAVPLENYRIKVWDDQDQTNDNPIVYPIEILDDLAPDVVIALPQQTPKDIPLLDQQIIEVHASDPDFGLSRIELQIRRGLKVVDTPVLWSNRLGSQGNKTAIYRFRPSELRLRVGDVVSVRAIATDNRRFEADPAIEPNRTSTDSIELRIVAPAESDSPTPEEGGNDGLSKKDDQPATGSGEGDEGQQGGGGSDGGGEASESDAPAEGGSPGGEGSSEQTENQSDEQGSGGQSSDDSDGGDTRNNGSESGTDSTDSPDESSGDQSNEEDPGAAADPTKPMDGGQGNESSGENPSDPTGDQTEDSGGQPGADGKQEPKPANDAEAFERIKDYLEDQQRKNDGDSSMPNSENENSSEGKSKDSPNDDSQSSGSKGQESGEVDGSKTDERNRDSGSKDGGAKPDDATEPKSDGSSEKRGGNEDGSAEQKEGESSSDGSSNEEADGEGAEQNRDSDDGKPGGDSKQSSESQDGAGAPNEEQKPPGGDEGGDSGESQDPQQGQPSQDGDSGQPGESPSGQSDSQNDMESKSDPGAESGESEAGGDPGTESNSNDGAESKSGDSKDAKPSPGKPSGDGSPSKSDANPDAGTPGSESKSGDSPQPSNQASTQASSNQTADGQQAGESADGSADAPPDPVDLDYAKKATDLVLDYLDETRSAPDPKLLEDLNWTPQDLREFQQRWQTLRDLESISSPDGDAQQEALEALESLGLDPARTTRRRRSGKADSLRNLRDGGNRSKPPASIRDAFDAFRRSVAQ